MVIAFISIPGLAELLLVSLIVGIILLALCGIIVYKHRYRGLIVLGLSILFFINYYSIQAFLFSFGDEEFMVMMVVLPVYTIALKLLLQRVHFRLIIIPLIVVAGITILINYYIHNNLIIYAKHFRYNFDYSYWLSKKTQDDTWPEAFNIIVERKKDSVIGDCVGYIFNSSVKDSNLETPSQPFKKAAFKAWAAYNTSLKKDAINPFGGIYPNVSTEALEALVSDGRFLKWWIKLAREDSTQLGVMQLFYQEFKERIKFEESLKSYGTSDSIPIALIGKLDIFKNDLKKNGLKNRRLEAEIDSCKARIYSLNQ